MSKAHDKTAEHVSAESTPPAAAAVAPLAFSWTAALAFLMKFGEQAPAAAALFFEGVELIQQGFEKFLAIAKLLGISPELPAPSPPTTLSITDEDECRAKCIALAQSAGGPRAAAIGDGKLLRGVGEFLRANPWVWQLLQGMLKGAFPLPVGA